MKFKIMMCSWGGTRREFASGLTEKEAIEICESLHWMYESPEGGYTWDLEIEEEN